MNILHSIGAGIAAVGIFIAGLFGYVPTETPVVVQETLGADTNLFAGLQTFTLAGTGMSSSATSFSLTSFTITQNGKEIQDGDLADTFYLTLEPGSRSRQEFISCTTVVQNIDDTATISGCTRGLSPIAPYTASSTLQFAHNGGTSVIFSNSPQFYDQFTAKGNDETITGVWSFPNPTTASGTVSKGYLEANALILTTDQTFAGNKTLTGNTTLSGTSTFATTTIAVANIASGTIARTPTVSTDIVNKAYADGLAIAGASNADETTKGIVEEGTQAEVNAGTATGATGASLYVAPDKLGGGVAATMAFYQATSTGSDTGIGPISVTADDTLVMWAQFNNTSCVSGSSQSVAGALAYKQSNLGATTTVSSVQNANAAGGISCNAVAIGMMTATTTMTVQVAADATSATYASLIVQHFIR